MAVAERRREVDLDKLRQKAEFLRDTLRRLREIRDEGREAFLESSVAEAATTRYLQIGIESIVDAANHIIAREGWGLPKTYQESIDLLIREGFLPRDRSETFRRMVKFRNRAVHLYDTIEPEQIWDIVQNHLEDFEVFLQALVSEYLAEG